MKEITQDFLNRVRVLVGFPIASFDITIFDDDKGLLGRAKVTFNTIGVRESGDELYLGVGVSTYQENALFFGFRHDDTEDTVIARITEAMKKSKDNEGNGNEI